MDNLRAAIEAIYLRRLPNPETGLFDVKSSIDDLEELFTAAVEDVGDHTSQHLHQFDEKNGYKCVYCGLTNKELLANRPPPDLKELKRLARSIRKDMDIKVYNEEA